MPPSCGRCTYSPFSARDTCQEHLSVVPVIGTCYGHLLGAPVRGTCHGYLSGEYVGVLTLQCQGCGTGTCQRHLSETYARVLTLQCQGHLSWTPVMGACQKHMVCRKHLPGYSYSPSSDRGTCHVHLSLAPVRDTCQKHLPEAHARV